MGFRSAPNWNPLSTVTRIGVVASWILLFVVWGSLAVLPFGLDASSPSVRGVGFMFLIIMTSQVAKWFSPPKTAFLDENGREPADEPSK